MADLLGRRDFYAGLFVVLIGLGTASIGLTYKIGSLIEMGSGLFPTALGILLIVIGVLIAATASQPEPEALGHMKTSTPSLRGGICILLGVLSFVMLGQYFGMALASFACVFISALGDRAMSLKAAFILALGVTVVGVVLFSYGLQSGLPIFSWGE